MNTLGNPSPRSCRANSTPRILPAADHFSARGCGSEVASTSCRPLRPHAHCPGSVRRPDPGHLRSQNQGPRYPHHRRCPIAPRNRTATRGRGPVVAQLSLKAAAIRLRASADSQRRREKESSAPYSRRHEPPSAESSRQWPLCIPPTFGWRLDRTFRSADFRAACPLELNISSVISQLGGQVRQGWSV